MAGELTDLEKARKDFLWGMFTEIRTHSRHAETLRTNVVNFMIVVESVLIAVIANDRRITGSDFVPCLAMTVIALVSLAFAASYTELHVRQRSRALRFRQAIDEEFFDGAAQSIERLLIEADQPHRASRLHRWGRLAGSTQRFWFVLPTMALLSGLVLCGIALA